MNTAIISGLIILVLLVIMLVAGVPIAVALGISSVCAILPVMDTSVAVLTGAQRIFFRYLRIQFAGHSVFYSGRKHYEQGRYCSPSD